MKGTKLRTRSLLSRFSNTISHHILVFLNFGSAGCRASSEEGPAKSGVSSEVDAEVSLFLVWYTVAVWFPLFGLEMAFRS